jgi:putative hemolysin
MAAMAEAAVEKLRSPISTGDDAVIFSYSRPEHGFLRRAIIQSIEKLSGQPRLKALYDAWRREDRAEPFFDAAIRLMGVKVRLASDLADIPRTGPVLFVANHPFGVLDGVALGWVAQRVRPDTRILTHSLLCQPPELKPHVLPIDFGGTTEARARSLASRLEAQRHLRHGGAVAIFPAGGVATCQTPFGRAAVDAPWHPFTAKLARTARATVVPIYFPGQNSRSFQLASHVSYSLRIALLFRETASRLGGEIDVAIGRPIPFEELEHLTDRRAMTLELRRRTLALARAFRPPGALLPDYRQEFHFPSYISE